MAFLPPGDLAPVLVLASGELKASAALADHSDPLDAFGHRLLHYVIELEAGGVAPALARVFVQPQFSVIAEPDPNNPLHWCSYLREEFESGASPTANGQSELSEYIASMALVPADLPYALPVSALPVRGRWQRVRVWGDATAAQVLRTVRCVRAR